MLKLVIILVFCASTLGCNYYEEKTPVSGAGGNDATADADPAFSWLSKNVLEPKCMRCHNTGRAAGSVNLTTLKAILSTTTAQGPLVVWGSANGSNLFRVVKSGAMPPGPNDLAANELEVLSCWIEKKYGEAAQSSACLKGAANSLTSSKPAVPSKPVIPPGPVTYKTVNEQIFLPYCTGCHSGETADADIELTSYDKIMAEKNIFDEPILKPGDAEHSLLYLSVESGFMPHESEPLDAGLKKLLKDWISAGAQP